jgi:hypothetical protein
MSAGALVRGFVMAAMTPMPALVVCSKAAVLHNDDRTNRHRKGDQRHGNDQNSQLGIISRGHDLIGDLVLDLARDNKNLVEIFGPK